MNALPMSDDEDTSELPYNPKGGVFFLCFLGTRITQIIENVEYKTKFLGRLIIFFIEKLNWMIDDDN